MVRSNKLEFAIVPSVIFALVTASAANAVDCIASVLQEVS